MLLILIILRMASVDTLFLCSWRQQAWLCSNLVLNFFAKEKNRKKRKRIYIECIMQVEDEIFLPLLMAATGGMGRESTQFPYFPGYRPEKLQIRTLFTQCTFQDALQSGLQRSIWDSVKHILWRFFAKIVNSIKSRTAFRNLLEPFWPCYLRFITAEKYIYRYNTIYNLHYKHHCIYQGII